MDLRPKGNRSKMWSIDNRNTIDFLSRPTNGGIVNRLKLKIVGLIKGTEYLIELPLWLYVMMMMSIAIIGASAFNALFGWIAYRTTADTAGVWVWPNSIAFDLCITSLLSFGITWMLSPTAAMRDIVMRSPLAIDPKTFPSITQSAMEAVENGTGRRNSTDDISVDPRGMFDDDTSNSMDDTKTGKSILRCCKA
ncbi:hypothetical protein Pmar_PMAR007063 [Perkinsus marinus ATCC 50983]|uniref:Uncharacterized protein n=1 Tax=Perkinsus marinus (strain ATCC 50983 / TXsc) TaxID=423536 RepID=C5KZN8_PERM5|nr:hypothetical protein Pmar_PMAR007063 [Perkinsus marinus ATCC 50983]EER10066.1 hypothetical protein Pmar_PMAR007063 [Perkinsus marinus ATCC 50983]|eukprot:XP_002778271.1 hypothetical protein Pmar_PMAR007063 [Perkinsus marinus ATCC 50983]